MKTRLVTLLLVAGAWHGAALADSTDARCDIYPAGQDHTDNVVPCVFSQRQGFINIFLEDGTEYALSPYSDDPGVYKDAQGRIVRRELELGDQGLIFRLPDESIYVYWNTDILKPADPDNPTAPFSTSDYDATTLLDCRGVGEVAFGTCPAGVLRMEDSQGSVVVQSPSGEQFTINFMTDYVNATNREVEAKLDGNTWTVFIDGDEEYRVPVAVIEGG